MELRQLRYFAVLAETLSFRRAAERLHISQPPLTVAIRKLEEELGAPLFTRSNRGVALTPAGEAALEFARASLLEAELVRQAVRAWSDLEGGRLALGFVSSSFMLLPRLLPAFRRRHPGVELIAEERTLTEISRGLQQRQIDVGVVRLPLPDPTHLDTFVIDVDELIAAVPESHPLARQRTISIAQLAGEPLVSFPRDDAMHAVILAACQAEGFEPLVKQEAAQSHTITTLVQSGLGIGLVARSMEYNPEGVRLLRLTEPLPIETAIVIARDAPSRLALSLRNLAQAEFAPDSIGLS